PDFLCDPMYGPDALTTVMLILGRARDPEGLERALSIAENLDDSTFRARAVTAAIHAMAEAGAFDRALEIAKRHDSSGVVPVVQRLIENGDRERATMLLDQSLREAAAVEIANESAPAYRAVADALLAFGMPEQARAAAAEALKATRLARSTTTGGE